MLENVHTFSVENRTRMYPPRPGVRSRSRRGAFDDQFDCELPPAARSELFGEIPPPQTYRRFPVSKSPPPARRFKGVIIAAITIAALLLYAVSVSRPGGPSTYTLTPESRSVRTPVVPPSQSVEVRRALPVEVRRALPVVPRALPLGSQTFTDLNTNWQSIRMPDGTITQASYQGELPSSAALPPQGRFIGEEWSTGNATWVWMTPAGANFPSWVDP
jgi:hypothetical protein